MLSLAMLWKAEAYPSAAGRCPAGEAAVSSSHVAEFAGAGKTVATGTLAEGGFSVRLNDVPLGGKPPSFRVGEEQTISITSDSNPFRGFLIRIGPPQGIVVDLRDAIQIGNGTDTQVATNTCVEVEQVGGLTHTSNTDKMEISGTLFVEQALSGIQLDVTVVEVNNVDASSYWYSSFAINSVVPVDPESPVAAPKFPTSPPSMSPDDETLEPAIPDDGDTTGEQETEEQETEGEDTSNAGTRNTTTLTTLLGLTASCLLAICLL